MHERLFKDSNLANEADRNADSLSSYEDEAVIALRHSSNLENSLNVKPDAISLEETESFQKQLTNLHGKIGDARSDYEQAKLDADDGEMEKVRKEMEKLGATLTKMHDQHFDQVGPDGYSEYGIVDERKMHCLMTTR